MWNCSTEKRFLIIVLVLWIISFSKWPCNAFTTLTVIAGTNDTFLPCKVSQSSVKLVRWYKGIEEKAHWKSGIVNIIHNETDRISVMEDFSLAFKPVRYNDTGEYRCDVDNIVLPENNLKLIVQDVPDPPGMPLIEALTSRSVNLSWTPSQDFHNSPIIHYLIMIGVGENGPWDTNPAVRTMTNATRKHITGLLPYTVYLFRIVAVNSVGRSLPGQPSYPMITPREVPSEKPVIVQAHNTSSTSIRVIWLPPPENSIHGELLGYKITYKDSNNGEMKEVEINDPMLAAHEIKGLAVFTSYAISVHAYNGEGYGPGAQVYIMTDEGVPSQPKTISISNVTQNSFKVKWSQPHNPNGMLKGYRIYYMHSGYTDTRVTLLSPGSNKPIMSQIIHGLEPCTVYDVYVKAFTHKGEGMKSDTIAAITDVQGPSAPHIINVTVRDSFSIYLQWDPPTVFYRHIDYYFVIFRSENEREFDNITIDIDEETKTLKTEILLSNLSVNTMYEIKIQAATKSIIQADKIYVGPYSESKKVILGNSLSATHQVDTTITSNVIAGVVCAAFALLLLLLAIGLWRKYFEAAYYYLDDPNSCRIAVPSITLPDTYDDSEYQSIPIGKWASHVAELHADGDLGFSKEYESIQQGQDLELLAEHSTFPENKHKNRYVNIIAYDHTRVILKTAPGQKKHFDYINANYIDGYHKAEAYIATQGPLPSTFADFWRMVWEQRTFIIVMITNLMERGRKKCDMYWPKEGSEQYGHMVVKLLNEYVMANYTVRMFTLKNLKIKKISKEFITGSDLMKHSGERVIYQYHFTNWPDHGVPDHMLPVLSFVRKSAAANRDTAGPIVVHCSAGVGRTGTYIVLDSMMRQIKHKQDVNVFGFLKHIRQQRNYLVQTEEQYIFLHDALLEYIESGETEISSSYFSRYVEDIQNRDPKNQMSVLVKQYMLVTSFKPKDFQIISAMKSYNRLKNRDESLVPVEGSRVHITPQPGVEGSDYINASFLQGFHKREEFIITQHPLRSTVTDFWQMVWDHNSQTIVLLSDIDQKYEKFWPDKEEIMNFGSFKVSLSEEIQKGNYNTIDFILESTQDDYELISRIIHCSNWPASCRPLKSVFELVHIVQQWHLEYQNGPLIIMDRLGGTDATTFCALTTTYHQLEYENHADVYQLAKLYHFKRPGIFKSLEDYLLLYKAVESLCENSTAIETCNHGTSHHTYHPLSANSVKPETFRNDSTI